MGKSWLTRSFLKHFTVQEPEKSQKQVGREAWLIRGVIPFNRWYIVPAAFFIQFCRGIIFSWSIFNKPIDTKIYGTPEANMAFITFYIAVGCQGLSAAFVGPILERNGPRLGTFIASIFFGLGQILTGVALYTGQIWLVYLGSGVFTGIGSGICFVSPISILQKWFPDHRSLASGIGVLGFGVGGIAMPKIAFFLIESEGIEKTFITIGLVYFKVISTCGFILRTPPPGYSPSEEEDIDKEPEQNLLEALSSKDFKLIYVTFFANIIFAMVAVSRLSNLLTDVFGITPSSAATIVTLFGCCDLIGRMGIPILSESIGRKPVHIIMLAFQVVILSGYYFVLVGNYYYLYLASIMTVAACYGGGVGTISVYLSEKFGTQNVGPLFGVIVTANSLVGIIGGVLSTSIFKFFNETSLKTVGATPYFLNAWWILIIVCIGLLCALFIKPYNARKVIVLSTTGFTII